MSVKNLILSKSNQYNHYKNQSAKLKKENKELKDKLKKIPQEEYEEGISVIIPSYKGENHIKPLLDSLAKQTLDPKFYELIFIINGELDSTMELIKEFILNNPEKDVILTYTPRPGVSNARNIGLKIAKKEYTGFIDDDDFVSPKYLEKLFEHSKPNRVVMTNFIDVDEETQEEIESNLAPFSVTEHGIIKEAPSDKFFDLAVITQAKSIPSFATKSVRFNTNLNNGVDVSYYSFLYPKFNFEFYFIDKEEEAIYYRIRRGGSISRPKMSYQFNVLDRLKVIDDLNINYNGTSNPKYKKYIKRCINGQSGFMKRYLLENPEDQEKVIKEVRKHDLTYFPYQRIEKLD